VKNNKVLILSSDLDLSTDAVCDWLEFFGKGFVRINDVDFNGSLGTHLVYSFSNSSSFLKVFGSSISSIWFRREFAFKKMDNIENNQIKEFISLEIFAFKAHLYSYLLEQRKVLGKNSQYLFPFSTSKIRSLLVARSVGLMIPETIISSGRSELLSFLEKNPKSIVKPLSNPVFIYGEKDTYAMYTRMISTDSLLEYEDIVFPSIVQEYIPKKYELRVFFIDGKIFTAAIFSQNNSRTSLDFRDYDAKKPNRVIPYRLPVNIVKKILMFMSEMGLNTGSIDIIVSDADEFIFLEVNVVGQYDWIAQACNYKIDKEIALFLNS